jgi:hypothetical protein
LIQLELALRIRRHEALHVFLGLLKGLGLIDEALADIVGEVVAKSAGHRVAFLKNQERRRPAVIRGHNRVPRGLEIVQIPLQLFGASADAGRAHDGAHAVGDLQVVHGLAHLIAILAFDAARHAARTRVVRHQHQESSGQTDVGGERRAFVAALLLFNLNDQLLAFPEQILDVLLALGGCLGAEVLPRDLFQRQKAMALRAVFDECRFETGLYAGDPAFIDIGFFLFP